MRYRRLGHTGLQISELSYGTWVTFGNQIDVRGAVEVSGSRLRTGCELL